MTSAPTTVLLVRHGETDWNRVKRLQGHIDVPLNATGREQAQRMAAALAGRPIDHIYSSDLQRAHDTARAVVDAWPSSSSAPQLTLEPGLRERHYGDLQGQTASDILARNDALTRIWRDRRIEDMLPGGETLADFHARVLSAVRRCLQAHAAPATDQAGPGPTLLFVTHGGVLDSLYRHATGLTLDAPRTWSMPNCALHHVTVDAAGRWQLLSWADESHLAGLAPRLDEISSVAVTPSGPTTLAGVA